MTRLIPPFEAAQTAAFLSALRGFLGAQWRHQGRLPTHMDCLGLVALSLHAVGAPVQDREGYGRTPYNRQLRASLVDHFGEPVDGELQPADIVTLRWVGEENHVAVVTDHPEGLGLIHCWANAPGAPSGNGRVCEHRMDDAWRVRVVEGFRP